MCLNPITVTKRGLAVKIACRRCQRCRDHYVRDYVGRNIAESKTAVGSNLITLTYKDDNDLGSRQLIYKDVQDWLKRVRESGHPVRFFIVGEHGKKKGRAHWHCLMYWQHRVPNYMPGIKNWNDKFWHKGHTQWDEFEPKAASYVCKYLLKDIDGNHVDGPHYSRAPALGTVYFYRLAEQYAAARVLPLDAGYSFDECRWRGERRKFMMQGVARRQFAQALVEVWEDMHGEHPLQRASSEWLESELDKLARNPGVTEVERRGYVRAPWLPPPEGAVVHFNEFLNNWVCDFQGRRLHWSFDSEGKRAWRSVIVTASEAEILRVASERARSPAVYRELSNGG